MHLPPSALPTAWRVFVDPPPGADPVHQVAPRPPGGPRHDRPPANRRSLAMPEMLTSRFGVDLAQHYAQSALPDAPVVTRPQWTIARHLRARIAAGLRAGARLEYRLADRLDQTPAVDPDVRHPQRTRVDAGRSS
jgi:hypothetical protein